MKAIWFLIPAAAALLATGCDKSGDGTAPASAAQGLIRVAVEPAATETRVTLDTYGAVYKWNETDRIGLFVEGMGGGSNIAAGLVEDENGTAYFKPDVVLTPGATVHAYYPYTDGLTPDAGNLLTVTLPDVQTAEYAGQLAPVMPMVAPAATVNEDGSLDLRFQPLCSIAGLRVWSSEGTYSDEQVLSVRLGSSDMLAGSYSFDYTNPDAAPVMDLTGSEVTLQLTNAAVPGSDKPSAPMLFVVVPAMELGGLNATVTTDKAAYAFTQKSEDPVPVGFRANTVHSISLDLSSAVRTKLLTGVPFTVAVYDYANREADGTTWGTIRSDYEREPGFPWDEIGYGVTLTDTDVVRYWVYCDLIADIGAFNDEALLEACIAKGTERTESDTVPIMVREGGPGSKTCAVAVAVEFKDGTRAVYRTHKIGSMRGGAHYNVWD